ncbi:Uma2 family endonuclease [Mycobacterium sp.]|uniref:Uma2 family endonuclease n=1 Tax=Mycobacterium sp. TaxID=1785 RepID=UPI003F960F5E
MSTITKPDTVTTVDEYDRMIEDGRIGEDDQVELWDGNVVPKMPKGPPHRVGTRKTVQALERVIPPVWHVAKEEGVVLSLLRKPEPDVAVIRAELEYDSSRDATAEDCCLVVEVADSSLTVDQGDKLEGYAEAGIPVYWIINLRAGQVEVYTDPDQAAGQYRNHVDCRPGQVVPVIIDGEVFGQIDAADLLP